MSVADADPTCSRMTQSSGRIACRFDGHIPSVDVKIRHGLPSRCLWRQLTYLYWLTPTGPMPEVCRMIAIHSGAKRIEIGRGK
jgi:hypothetical protein